MYSITSHVATSIFVSADIFHFSTFSFFSPSDLQYNEPLARELSWAIIQPVFIPIFIQLIAPRKVVLLHVQHLSDYSDYNSYLLHRNTRQKIAHQLFAHILREGMSYTGRAVGFIQQNSNALQQYNTDHAVGAKFPSRTTRCGLSVQS